VRPLDVLTLAVLAYVGFRLADAARHAVLSRSYVRKIVGGLRWRHFLLALPVLAVVVSLALLFLQIPGLSFGWWTALGGEGNPVFGSAPPQTVGRFNAVIPIVFAVLLVIGLPLLVEAEEWVFRRGAEYRSGWGNLRWAVSFGLVHALVGIPIGAALALSVGGVYLTWTYLRMWSKTGSQEEALIESTRAHLAYNLVIVAIVASALLAGV
jgi:hypothetical protein